MDVRTAFELTEDHLLLDVREPHEWDEGHATTAVHLPMGQLGPRQDELPTDRLIVVACRSGGRSARVTQMLRQAGYQAENLEGGMKAWLAEGLPMEAADGAVPKVD